MLISCPECGKEISDKVKACPHCGYPFDDDGEDNDTIDDNIDIKNISTSPPNFFDRNHSTIKLTIGIISIILSVPVFWQSFLLYTLKYVADSLSSEPVANSRSGFAFGIVLAIIFLVCGIVNIVNRKNIHSGFAVSIFYLISAILGIFYSTYFSDLKIWSVVSVIFAGFTFLCHQRKTP